MDGTGIQLERTGLQVAAKEADLPQMKQNAADKVHASSLWYRVQMRVGIDISLCGLFCPTEKFLRLV